MMVMTTQHHIQTTGQGDVHDITDVVARAVSESGLSSGIATTSVVGSTAAVTTIECDTRPRRRPFVVQIMGE